LSIEPKFIASENDIDRAANMLAYWMGYSKDMAQGARNLRNILEKIFPHINMEKMYASLELKLVRPVARVADKAIPKLIVELLQLELLSNKDLRKELILKMYEKDNKHPLFLKEKRIENTSELLSESYYDLKCITEIRWIPGGRWARKFTKAFNFPEIFAGIPSSSSRPSIEDVERPPIINEMQDFQDNIMSQVMLLLKERNREKNRGIIHLPTGAGKTRIAVEALLKFWKNRTENMRYMIWIAQTDELCEQAVQSFKEIWTAKGEPGQTLRIFRYWGDAGRLPTLDEEGVIVAGINKLYEDTTRYSEQDTDPGSELYSLTNNVCAVVIDEAHHSTTRMYHSVFKALNINFNSFEDNQAPILGLTATPFRGYNHRETESLLNKYNRNILYPKSNGFSDMWKDWDWMKRELTSRGILSKINHKQFGTDVEIKVKDEDINKFGNHIYFQPKFFTTLGNIYRRNRIIHDKLLELAQNKNSILFFAPSVRNAIIMSALMGKKGFNSAAITGETGSGIRQMYIKKFKEEKIQILCNYSVLTTGFDAPKIDAVLIARPTESPVLYQQMIGRGLRGPSFGGTEECVIWDLVDNISFHTKNKQGIFTDGSTEYWKMIDVNEIKE
jgi:DNA repair protein RadD